MSEKESSEEKKVADGGALELVSTASDLMAIPLGDLPIRTTQELHDGALGYLTICIPTILLVIFSPWLFFAPMIAAVLVVVHTLFRTTPGLSRGYLSEVDWTLDRASHLLGLGVAVSAIYSVLLSIVLAVILNGAGSLAVLFQGPALLVTLLAALFGVLLVVPTLCLVYVFGIPEVLAGRDFIPGMRRARQLMLTNLPGNLALFFLTICTLTSLPLIMLVLLQSWEQVFRHSSLLLCWGALTGTWSLVLWTLRWKQLALQRGEEVDQLLE